MSETKPEKRLVSKRQYVRPKMKKRALWLLTVICLAIILLMGAFLYVHLKEGLTNAWLLILGFTLVLTLCTAGLVEKVLTGYPRPFSQEGNPVDPNPTSGHNAHLLPVEDTLLRGSDLPPTIQQAELLRATHAGQETQQEQLLRAVTGKD